MKYIIIDNGFTKCPVIFHGIMTHSEIAERLKGSEGKVVSAGHVALVDGKVQCYGESITLGLGMGPNDAEIIEDGLDP